MALTVVACTLVLAGCAGGAEVARGERTQNPSPVVRVRPAPAVKAAVKPVNTATPYSFLVPWVGIWQWSGDPAFHVTLELDRRIQYGPLFSGTYRLVDDKTIELTVMGKNGERPGPILFRMEFAEGGALMAWTQGSATLVFQRLSVGSDLTNDARDSEGAMRR